MGGAPWPGPLCLWGVSLLTPWGPDPHCALWPPEDTGGQCLRNFCTGCLESRPVCRCCSGRLFPKQWGRAAAGGSPGGVLWLGFLVFPGSTYLAMTKWARAPPPSQPTSPAPYPTASRCQGSRLFIHRPARSELDGTVQVWLP